MNLTPADFDSIREVVRQLCGLALTSDKDYLVTSRLSPLLKHHRLNSYLELINRLRDPRNQAFRGEVIDAISTNETSFNRDGHPFETLRRVILPDLVQQYLQAPSPTFGRKIRIWSAAASTGQEAFSIAMAIYQMLDARPPALKAMTADLFSILATDVSQRALTIARNARYPGWELDRGITPEQKKRFFVPDDQYWTATPEVRRLIEFQKINLVEQPPELGMFDLIFCRNLLIYFDEATRSKVCAMFQQLLKPNGYFIIGAAESLYGISHGFRLETIGNTQVYRKLG